MISFHTNPRLLATVPVLVFIGLTTVIAIAPATEMNARYPVPDDALPVPPEVARGRKRYIAEGCSVCHTQQVRGDTRRPRDESGNVPVLPQDRRYGARASRPEDYAGQDPPLLGSERTGPDLANVGIRNPSADWHYLHLFDPRAVSPSSIMPPYRHAFRSRDDHGPDDRKIALTDEVRAKVEPDDRKRRDVEVWATRDAQDLVAYLLSLRQAADTR